MDASKRLDALVATLREDVVSGASELVRTAADILSHAADGVHVDSVPALRAAVAHACVRMLDAQPAMAPLVPLAGTVLDAIGGAASVEEAREAARAAARDFADAIPTRAAALARRAAPLLPREGDVLTLSSSSTVLGTLLLDPTARRGKVVVLESRPVREGRDAARALGRAGVPVLFAVDAAVGTLVAECACVLLGADSIGDRGVVNKIGSLAAVLAARHAGVPVLFVADGTKILPPGFPQYLADDRPTGQVWHAPSGVRVWNRYFEAVPLEEPDRVVTEDAVLSAAQVDAHRRSLAVPEELRGWAERRGGVDPRRAVP